MRRSYRLAALGIALAGLLATAAPAVAAAPRTAGCATGDGSTVTRSYRVAQRDDVSLDIHAPAGTVCTAPVVMWVHGGGYTSGDKANQLADKISLFNGQGWLLVSVNYRLTVPGDPSSAHFPMHYNDVSKAVGWVHDNIAAFGGDPSRIALLGHSAGADIVANVADNPVYLGHQNLPLSALRCAGPLDTEGFNKVTAEAGEQSMWQEALGNDPNYAEDTSPTRYAAAGTGIPATIGVYRGTDVRRRIEQNYLRRLSALGVPTTLIDARSLDHAGVNNQIGAPGDTVMTPPLMQFLHTCLA